MAGFQLWVNLPAKEKLCDPAYHEYPKDQIPVEHRTPGVDINVITGTTSEGTAGPVKGVATSPLYFGIRLSPGASIDEFIPLDHAGFVFVNEGEISVKSDTGSDTVAARQLGVLGAGNAVHIEAKSACARVLLVAAQVLNEPVARYGPFVMNTREEVVQAVVDFQNGKMGRL